MNSKTIELYGLISLSILTLVALLAYTFVHTGGLLSEYVNPWQVGYVAAFGVEAAIITMSIRIGKLLRHLARSRYKGLEGWMSLLWQGSTLLFVLAVSAAANVVEGHKVKYGLEMTLATIQDLDALQVAIGLLATGLIPVVVLSMTEIVSGEIKSALETESAIATATVATIKTQQPAALSIAPLTITSLPKAQPAIEFSAAPSELVAVARAADSSALPDWLMSEEAAPQEEPDSSKLSLSKRVTAILNNRPSLSDAELYELLPGSNQKSIRVYSSAWRKEHLATTSHNGNGHH